LAAACGAQKPVPVREPREFAGQTEFAHRTHRLFFLS
jgi:hypothetical protein